MLNEEIHAQYQAVNDLDDVSQSQDNQSSIVEGQEGLEEEYGDEDVIDGEMLEYTKIKRENVFAQIDYSKRKTKIVCTLG